MNKQLNDIIILMDAMLQEVKDKIDIPDLKVIMLRTRLGLEELRETREAIDEFTKREPWVEEDKKIELYKEIIDGIVDQIVILAGTLNAYGVSKGDVYASSKWDSIFDAHKTAKRFSIPDSINFFEVEKYHKSIKERIIQLDGLAKEAFFRGEGVEQYESDFKFLLHSLLDEILNLSEACGFSDMSLFSLCWDEVQGSNMSKLGEDGKPIFREDGKFTKGPNYWKPDLGGILKKYIG